MVVSKISALRISKFGVRGFQFGVLLAKRMEGTFGKKVEGYLGKKVEGSLGEKPGRLEKNLPGLDLDCPKIPQNPEGIPCL